MQTQLEDDDHNRFEITITKRFLDANAGRSLAPGFEFTADPALLNKVVRDGVNRFSLVPGLRFDHVTVIEKIRVMPCAGEPDTLVAFATRVAAVDA